jgi:hypothetical protein
MATRRRSRTFTTQGEVDCAYHVCSKLMLKNMVEFVMQLPVSEQYDKENCNQFLNTRRIKLEGLTREKCTLNGYLKIVLFHYFYTLYYLFMRPEYLSFSTSHIDAIEDKLILPIPSSVDNYNDIKYVMRRVNHVKNTLGIEWKKTTVITKKQKMFSFIEKVTDLGFYVAINLIDYDAVGRHVNHSVVCIGTDDKLLIKNSWGDEEVYEMEIHEKLQLNEYSFRVSSCVFYLPCRILPIESVFNRETTNTFSEWLDNYVRDFPEMVAPIPAILASTPDSDPPPEIEQSKRMHTFEVGDAVYIKDVGRGKIISKVGNDFEVFYTDKGIEKERAFSASELIKVGGRRKSRKRIR